MDFIYSQFAVSELNFEVHYIPWVH